MAGFDEFVATPGMKAVDDCGNDGTDGERNNSRT